MTQDHKALTTALNVLLLIEHGCDESFAARTVKQYEEKCAALAAAEAETVRLREETALWQQAKHSSPAIDVLKAENAKLREALEFYGRDDVWRRNRECDPEGINFTGPNTAWAALATPEGAQP